MPKNSIESKVLPFPTHDVSTRRLQKSTQAVGRSTQLAKAVGRRHRFTAELVHKFPAPATGEAFYRCDTIIGFGIRVRPNNARAYFVETRVRGGKAQRRALGKVGSVTFQHAQSEARRLIGLARTGEDIHERPSHGDQTLTQAWEALRTARAGSDKPLRATTLRRYGEAFARLAPWANKPLFSISRADVSELFQQVMRERGPTAASQTFRFFRMVWNYAAAIDEHAPAAPTVVLRAQRLWPRAKRRERVVAEKDFPRWWHAMEKLKPEWRAYFLGLALTGCRRMEWLNLKWAHVDLRKKLVTLPPEITKAGRAHALPIGPHLVKLLRDLQEYQGKGREYVFSHDDGSRFEHPGNVIRRHRERTKIQWSPHDLRRVFLTTADELGIATAVQKALVNHSLGDVTDGYKIAAAKKRREAMLKIERAILARARCV
jgi:integrase